jgi:hypothetical protein
VSAPTSNMLMTTTLICDGLLLLLGCANAHGSVQSRSSAERMRVNDVIANFVIVLGVTEVVDFARLCDETRLDCWQSGLGIGFITNACEAGAGAAASDSALG